MSRPGIGRMSAPARSTTWSGSVVPSWHQLLNRIVKVARAPGSRTGAPSSATGALSSRTVPAAARTATAGPAGSMHALEPRFSTDTSVPRLPAAAPHVPPVSARSVGAHGPPASADGDGTGAEVFPEV